MVLSSKELTIIFIEFLIGILLIILSFRLGSIDSIDISSITTWILLAIVVIVVLALVFAIIYKRLGELDKALEMQETKYEDRIDELEKSFKRAEDLIDIRADINYLKEKCK